KSAVLSFNVTSTLIENGTQAHIFCEADGNPAPTISVIKGNTIIAQSISGYFLFHNKTMSCKDAGYYLCQADNGIDFNNRESKQLTVVVGCTLQFNTAENIRNFSLQHGQLFTYNFTIYGYPEPDKYLILKSNEESYSIAVTSSSMEPPYITIELKIASLTPKDFDSYVLIIYQNRKQSLTFGFTIHE
ncbi:hemicentin-1, partial [Biomphalaria glabrata]